MRSVITYLTFWAHSMVWDLESRFSRWYIFTTGEGWKFINLGTTEMASKVEDKGQELGQW